MRLGGFGAGVALAALAMGATACGPQRVAPGHDVPPREGAIRVLILDGQNNHDWPRVTASLRQTLDDAALFSVAVSTTPPPGSAPEAWDAWQPDFAAADVVVSNYNGEAWPQRVQDAFVAFVGGGGGAVMVHAANNAFPEWADYNLMIGLGWRDADYGDRITIDDATGDVIRTPAGVGPGAGHGDAFAFPIKVRRPDHPIMRGLPAVWMHGTDQLTHGQRGPARDMTVLDSAYSPPDHYGTGEHEPMTWAIPFGQGQVVTTMMGHLWADQIEQDAIGCVGFRTIFARAVEWVATGGTTIPVPANFPTETDVSIGLPAR
jgi:type 1 glutamine amidotransferase